MNKRPPQKVRQKSVARSAKDSEQKSTSTEIAVQERSYLQVELKRITDEINKDFDNIAAEVRREFDRTAADIEADFAKAKREINFTNARAEVDTAFDKLEQALGDEADQVEAETTERDGDPHELMVRSLTAFTSEQDELDDMLAKLRSWTPPWVSMADQLPEDAPGSPETS